MRTGKKMLSVLFVVSLLAVCDSAYAQQEKGDIEVLLFSGSFLTDVDVSSFRFIDFEGSEIESSVRIRGFNIGGSAGYFITRRHEVGGGLNFFVSNFKSCRTVRNNGQVIDEDCRSNTDSDIGLSGFYRYNFAREGAKGFPFIGGDFSVGSLRDNSTGNFSARPHVGYKYFFKKNVALDLNVGYSMDLNRVGGFERGGRISGRVGFSFVF
jgi:hypothetical protein